MNKLLISFSCFLFLATTSNAQYTDIINSSRPGYTESPYAVGTNVLQLENTSTYTTIEELGIQLNDLNNNITFRYGFWKERLEANLNHEFTHSTNNGITGTKDLSLGLKYLIYEPKIEETSDYKTSWKKRYGFKISSLIPSVAVRAQLHTSLTNERFRNGGLTTYTLGVITQNNISRKLSINNQFDYYKFGGDEAEFIYAISASYVYKTRWNPYFEYRFHSLDSHNFSKISIGTPFLLSEDLSISAHYNAVIGTDAKGSEFGINASYRFDNHYDRWKRIPKEENDENQSTSKNSKKRRKKRKKKVDQEDVNNLILEY